LGQNKLDDEEYVKSSNMWNKIGIIGAIVLSIDAIIISLYLE